jgi:tetratricopeptide (TPR) repeat protein
MKNLLFVLFLLLGTLLRAQTSSVEQFVKQGVDLHDRGYYEEALAKYDSALALDKNNFAANYEKTYTLVQLKRYTEAVDICKQLVAQHASGNNLSRVYTLYGNTLDMLNRKKEALEIYDEGIKDFPDESLLYYNKAITLLGINQPEQAIQATKWALVKNPLHASSHKIMADVNSNNTTLKLMAAISFLAIEPEGERAKEQLKFVKSTLLAEAKKTGDNSYSVNIDPLTLLTAKQKKEDDFSSANMILSLASATNVEEKYKDETAPERFQRNLKTIISILKETAKDGKGFGWQFYVPFFVDLDKEGYLETLSHIALATDDDTANNSWLSQNKDKVNDFYKWLKGYKWPTPKL